MATTPEVTFRLESPGLVHLAWTWVEVMFVERGVRGGDGASE